MTDNELIKALDMCLNSKIRCADCAINRNYGYCINIALKEAFDLIKRQKAEIEKLKDIVNKRFDDFASEYDRKIKSEAIKEFAATLKRYYGDVITEEEIDNLVREMTEEAECCDYMTRPPMSWCYVERSGI